MNIRLTLIIILGVCAALWAMPGAARGQTPTPSPGDLFASINGASGEGRGSLVQFARNGNQTTVASPLTRPRGIAFDGSGNLFLPINIVDTSGNFEASILEFTPPAAMGTTFATGFGPNLFIEDLKFDSSGNLFAIGGDAFGNPTVPITIFKITPQGTVNTFASFAGQFFFGLAFDSAGNLYAAGQGAQVIYKFSPTADRSVFADSTKFAPPFTSLSSEGPTGLAFDTFGNLFVSTEDSNATGAGTILKFTLDGTESTFAGGLTNNPRGIAFDGHGNLFVADVSLNQTGDILEFAPDGTETIFASGLGSPAGNGGPEFLTFVPGSNTATPAGSNVTTNAGTVGFATISLTFPSITTSGTTTVTPVNPSSAGYTLPGSSLAFDITTTAAYPTPVPTPPGIVIAFQVAPPLDVSQLTVFHNEGGQLVNVTCPSPRPGPTPDTTTNTIYASVTSLSPFVVAKVPFAAHVQQPINSDGSSVFSVRRGAVPVKFTLTQDGTSTCALPAATIAVTRTAGGTIGPVSESVYGMPSDSGSNFRIDSCQYVYNLNAGAMGIGTYRVDVKINGIVVGSAIFRLN